jgi:hypothetical protein
MRVLAVNHVSLDGVSAGRGALTTTPGKHE